MLTEAALLPSEGALHSCTPSFLQSGDRDGAGVPIITAKAEVVIDTPHRHEHTNSVNRSYSDLDNTSFLFWAFALCAARTAVQQPMNLALARKQTSAAYAALSTRAVLQRIYRREGGLRGLAQGMCAMTLGCALSEVIYLFLFEFWRERAPLASDAQKDAAAGYAADALCRFVHIPMSIIAFRQMTAGSGPSHSSSPPSSFTVRAQSRGLPARLWCFLRGCRRGRRAAVPSLHHQYNGYGSGWGGTPHVTAHVTAGGPVGRGAGEGPFSVAGKASRAASRPAWLARLWGPRGSVAARNSWRTLANMYRENGVRAVFAGYGMTIVIGCQWSALWWALYGVTKVQLYTAAAPLLVDDAERDGVTTGCRPQSSHARNSNRLGSDDANSRTRSSENRSRSSQQESDTAAWLRRTLPAWCLAKDDNLLINSAASIFTGATTAVVFNPFLVIRTNLQTTPMATLRSATRAVFTTRGIRGFYGGLWLSVVACVCDGVLASTSYEYAKLWADTSRNGQREGPDAASTGRAGAVASTAAGGRPAREEDAIPQ